MTRTSRDTELAPAGTEVIVQGHKGTVLNYFKRDGTTSIEIETYKLTKTGKRRKFYTTCPKQVELV